MELIIFKDVFDLYKKKLSNWRTCPVENIQYILNFSSSLLSFKPSFSEIKALLDLYHLLLPLISIFGTINEKISYNIGYKILTREFEFRRRNMYCLVFI